MENNTQKSLLSLLPFFVFVAVFLLGGILSGNFYALPAPIAVLCGVITAFLVSYKNGIDKNLHHFIKGCGEYNILIMCLITLLAGAFSVLTNQLGATQTIVEIANNYLSVKFLYVGVFILASFLSFSSGTSTGTITALTPIVAGFIPLEGVDAALISACLLGGAMFGDNLSFISDTTIAATQSQGCEMKDKFKINSKIAFPASILTILLLIFISFGSENAISEANLTQNIQWIKILPYLIVILMAIFGVNVFVTLFLGVISAGILFYFEANTSILEISQIIYKGFASMNEILLVFLLMGGLSLMVEKSGGIAYITEKLSKLMTTPLRAKLGIAFLVSVIDFSIANNTIAIVVSSPVAKDIAEKFNIKPSHTASILDIFSCIMQGILPYGAQILILFKLIGTDLSYIEVISKSYYLIFLLICSIFFFFIKKSR